MVRFNGVNHLAMATGDMDMTIRFWRDLLGMRLVTGLGEPGYRQPTKAALEGSQPQDKWQKVKRVRFSTGTERTELNPVEIRCR